MGDRCTAPVQKDFFGVFQSLHRKISRILLIAKPSQLLLSMVVGLLIRFRVLVPFSMTKGAERQIFSLRSTKDNASLIMGVLCDPVSHQRKNLNPVLLFRLPFGFLAAFLFVCLFVCLFQRHISARKPVRQS